VRVRKPRNAALEFAKAFTYLVAQEGCRQGKGRTLDARKFEKWARAIIRAAGGDPDKVGDRVGRKLHWLVYDQRRKWQMDLDFCIKRGRAMAWRHKVLIAEHVLTDGAMSLTAQDKVEVMRSIFEDTWTVIREGKRKI
jgi:hypothetical protein